jgi:hypothetical protein
LQIQPDGQDQVVSLVGGAFVRLTDMGWLSAGEIHLWLIEEAAAAAPRGSVTVQPVALVKGEPTSEVKIRPDRMLAQGAVRIDSPQLVGSTTRLEVRFAQVAASAATAADPGQRGSMFGGGRARRKERSTPMRFDVGGALLQVRLAMHDQQPEVVDVNLEADANLKNSAHFTEVSNPLSGEKPLSMRGQNIHVAQADSPQAHVEVSGKPAVVEGRGMSLSGAKIQLERAANRLWVEGPGRMTLPMKTDMAGRPASGQQTLDVTWQQGMNFDGRTALFERKVVARGEHARLQTEKLSVSLKRRIELADARPEQRKGEAPEIETVACAGGVVFDASEFDKLGTLSAIDHVETRDLAINRTSGDVKAQGPGWLTSVRFGSSGTLLGQSVVAGGQPPAAARGENGTKERLMCLSAHFEREINGNVLQRKLTLFDHVKTIYGPVDAWDQRLDPEKMGRLGPQEVIVDCDQLTVREMPSPQRQQPGSIELEALGNARVEGETFTARGHQITYAREKDLLVLQGDGRSAAQLHVQAQEGGPVSPTTAGEIKYWPSTKRIELDDVQSIDSGEIPGAFDRPGQPRKK